ncbi:hypothetical protein F4778DRAFT_729742 [Xylariomycetidae sp. FL2044]|nr:hypothetical protein F4778DRAFT_729742 [Xylariomycetidae sp. FL2044]
MMKPGSHLPATTIFLIYASSYQSEDRPQLPNMEVHELRNMAINVVAPTIQNIAWMSGQFVDEARNWLGSASVLGAWGEYVRGRPQGITTSDLDEVTILTLIDAVGTLVDDPARDTHELYLMNPDKSAWDHVMHVKRFLVALLVDNERGGLWQGDGPRGKIGGYFRVIIAFKVLQYVEQEVGDRRPVSDAEQAQVTAAHNQFTELMAGVLNHIVDRRRPSGTSNV